MDPEVTQRGDAAIQSLDPPEIGSLTEVAPGVLWARLPLPYAPGHVNAYLLQDEGGWAAIDTGLDDAPTRAAWERILDGRHLTRVVVTHWHSDHLGLAGWLCGRFGIPLLMSETEYLHGLMRRYEPLATRDDLQRSFFLSHGLAPDVTEAWIREGRRYLDMVAPVPTTFVRVFPGQSLLIGSTRFDVITMPGHSPESVMLHAPDAAILLCADQAIPGIAPILAVQAFDPDGDPLALYLDSLGRLQRVVPPDVLVLPGHGEPYRGLHACVLEIERTLRSRSRGIAEACGGGASAGDLLPVLFAKPIGPDWIGFVVSDIVAHLNHLAAQGELVRLRTGSRVTFQKASIRAGSADGRSASR